MDEFTLKFMLNVQLIICMDGYLHEFFKIIVKYFFLSSRKIIMQKLSNFK